MKRLLGITLIASLLAAPAVMAQTNAPSKPKSAPETTPVGSAPGGGMSDKTTTNQPPQAGPSATVGGKDAPNGKVHGVPEAKQDGKQPAAPGGADAKKAWDEAAKPGPNHKLLEWFAGEWQVAVKDLTPGQESTDEGVMTAKMVYGGRFLSSEFDGRFHGKFFRGGGMMGYNNTSKKFESTWADARDTSISFMTGAMSADNKVLTMTSEMTDPATGKKVAMKEVDKITGKDTYTGEFFMGDTKVMELSYVRGKAAEKKDDKKEEKPKTK
jgi:hypothetical protein